MAPCLPGAHKWAVVGSRKGQARRPHASTLTLSHSLLSRVAVVSVPWTLVFPHSSWNPMGLGRHSDLYERSTSACLKGQSARTTARVLEISGREEQQAVYPSLGSSVL